MSGGVEWLSVARTEVLAKGALLAINVGDVRMVLFRTEQGILAALQDRCPHRFAPLSMGSVHGATVQCAYHGLRFGADGVCEHNPHGEIPPQARVRSYAVREEGGDIFVASAAERG